MNLNTSEELSDFWSVHIKHFTLAKDYVGLLVKAKGNNQTGEDL